MQITIQYLDGCPNLSVVNDRLAAVGIDPHEVRFVSVASPTEGDAIQFRGSPTILVDDEDVFAEASAPAGFACRIYRTESGLDGAPSVQQLQEALGRRSKTVDQAGSSA